MYLVTDQFPYSYVTMDNLASIEAWFEKKKKQSSSMSKL